MAIVSSYPQGTPTLNDTVIGTQYVENKEPVTKQFNINDIVDLVPVVYTQLPYKVFTALLTQKGSGDPQSWSTTDGITIGASYLININTNLDVTNIGAPNNNVGTYFIATGTTPASPGVPFAFLFDPGAPVATVLENTIGNVWFTYSVDGEYYVNSSSLFETGKVFTLVTNNIDVFNFGIFQSISLLPVSLSQIFLATGDVDGHYNDILNNTPIEIRVYN